MFDLSFIRITYLQIVLNAVKKRYGITTQQIGIPDSLMNEPMALVPFNDFMAWLEKIAVLSGDPAYMLKISSDLCFSQMGSLGEWYLSSPDLALAVRRINYGVSCLHSGATYHGEQSGKIMKWSYDSPYARQQARCLDSLRVATMMIKALRHYMGNGYAPLKVQISSALMGNNQADWQQAEKWFGCAVEWNAPMTKVWIDLSILRHGSERAFSISRPMVVSNLQLDDMLNIPQPNDSAKVMFELVNYSRRYGVPNIEFVAEKLGFSKQQLQRRLHQFGWTFSNITQYVICNLAIQYMQAGKPIEDISQLLGYTHPQSFTKAFQRQRGLTPKQYQQRLLERSRETISLNL